MLLPALLGERFWHGDRSTVIDPAVQCSTTGAHERVACRKPRNGVSAAQVRYAGTYAIGVQARDLERTLPSMSTQRNQTMLVQLAQFSRFSTDFLVRLLRGFLWPTVDLVIRLWLAKIFVVFGILELTGSQTAFGLAAYVHAIKFISPLTAADIGTSIEVLGPLFPGAGLHDALCSSCAGRFVTGDPSWRRAF
jgi:hypothetical protein